MNSLCLDECIRGHSNVSLYAVGFIVTNPSQTLLARPAFSLKTLLSCNNNRNEYKDQYILNSPTVT